MDLRLLLTVEVGPACRWPHLEEFLTDGRAREVSVVTHPEPEENWQTEIQMPISQSSTSAVRGA